MKKIILTLSIASMLVACCTNKKTAETIEKTEDTDLNVSIDTLVNRPLLGGDRDEHGCIPSAGYIWCEKLQKCIRPWEEKCE